jgi:Ca2+-transporting ATPase
MLDPKGIQCLLSLGGITGLLRGLGTNRERGLSTVDVTTRTHYKHGGLGASHPHDSEKLPDNEKTHEIVLTETSGAPTDDGSAFNASFDDRKNIYGKNVLPTRVSKTLLQLIWAAMKDKVLVHWLSNTFANVVRTTHLEHDVSHFNSFDFLNDTPAQGFE